MAKTEFELYLANELENELGTYMPVKAGVFERLMVKKAPVKKIHPNPDDEFCFPNVGPSYRIISDYEKKFRDILSGVATEGVEPVIVMKTNPSGYMLVNGHHRWAGAMKAGMKKLPIKIINMMLDSDLEMMIKNSDHDKRVTLDLDEVVFRSPGDKNLEKVPMFFHGRLAKKRIKLGIPALFHYLTMHKYDIWVYSADYYSIDDIKKFFKKYQVNVDGIITGTGKKNNKNTEAAKNMEKLIANKYARTIHIDNDMMVVTHGSTGEFQDYEIDAPAEEWSKKVLNILQQIEKK
jgi:hypothetical protein